MTESLLDMPRHATLHLVAKEEPLGFKLLRISSRLVFAVITIILLPFTVHAQDATVTIYNHGSKWSTGLPGTNHNGFWGCIYDNDVRLSCYREHKVFSQMKFDRFAVFHLPAGQHVFSASYSKHPPKRSQLGMLLEPGKHYYLRAQSESRGIIEIEVEYGRVDNVPCADAVHELEKAKPLPDKLLTPEGRAASVAGQVVPPCS